MVRNKGSPILWSFIGVLLTLNCLLLSCVVGLRRSVQLSARGDQATKSPRSEGQRAQKDEAISALHDEVSKLKHRIDTLNTAKKLNGSSALEIQLNDSTDSETMLDMLVSRPAIEEIPILDEVAFEELRKRGDRIPVDITPDPLLKGDIDSVLQNKEWNPSGRELEHEERAELAVLLKDYRFYGMISRQERLKNDILPLVDSMRAQGRYIDHPSDQPPPQIDGAKLVHSDSTNDPAINRYYHFVDADHAELYHAHNVEDQRSLETVVRIYELINQK